MRGADVIWRRLNRSKLVFSEGGRSRGVIHLFTSCARWMLLLQGEHNGTCSHIWEVAPLSATANVRASDSDWCVCCGLALNSYLTMSRSDRILNALGKQCEFSMSPSTPPPRQKGFFIQRSRNTSRTAGTLCTLGQDDLCFAYSFLRWPGSCGWVCIVTCCHTQWQITLHWLYCHSF